MTHRYNFIDNDDVEEELPRMDLRDFMKEFLNTCQTNPTRLLDLNSYVIQYGVEKRRLYELFSVLCAIDVCVKNDHAQTYIWKGIQNLDQKIFQLGIETEMKALTTPLEELFEMNPSPKISEIAINYVKAVIYFMGSPLSFRTLAILMTKNQQKIGQIIRRLYPISTFLVGIDVLCEVEQKTVFSLNPLYNETLCRILVESHIKQKSQSLSVINLLNKVNSNYITSVKESRLQSLERAVNSKKLLR